MPPAEPSPPDSIQHDPVTPKLAPTPRLSPRALLGLLVAVCLLPLIGLSLYAIMFGRAAEHRLPVAVHLDRQFVETRDGQGAVLTEVVVVENQADYEIPNLTIDINGQYFLYRDSPLGAREVLAVPQRIFATKSNQAFTPGRYPITDVTVTGKLPSSARGVTVTEFPAQSSSQQ